MRILVTGQNGQLGKSIHKVVTIKKLPNEFFFVGRQELDLSSIDSIKGFFNQNTFSFENTIIYKVDNEIITSYDIKKELKY